MKFSIWTLFYCLLAMAWTAAEGQTVVLSGNLDQPSNGNVDVDNNQWIAQEFSTTEAFDLTQVSMDLEQGNGDGEFEVSIYTSADDEPGTLLDVLATPDSSELTSTPFVLSGLDVALDADSTYFLEVSGVTLTESEEDFNAIVWDTTDSASGNGSGYSSVALGGQPGSWSNIGDPTLTEIDGTAAVPEGSTAGLMALGVVGLLIWSRVRKARV
jgi:predicted Rdx family selenoprotein